jgi:hypothetical protein
MQNPPYFFDPVCLASKQTLRKKSRKVWVMAPTCGRPWRFAERCAIYLPLTLVLQEWLPGSVCTERIFRDTSFFIVDCTYKTNLNGIPLLNVIGVTVTSCFSAALVILSRKEGDYGRFGYWDSLFVLTFSRRSQCYDYLSESRTAVIDFYP